MLSEFANQKAQNIVSARGREEIYLVSLSSSANICTYSISNVHASIWLSTYGIMDPREIRSLKQIERKETAR